MINLELFCCAGGMAEGFRRAGITFDVAIDFAPDHCDSYERNLGHRPIAMDARDALRLVKSGALRWSQIGQAMPPALAEAVARSIVRQDDAARDRPEQDSARSQGPLDLGAA